jgi:hypothetical protein
MTPEWKLYRLRRSSKKDKAVWILIGHQMRSISSKNLSAPTCQDLLESLLALADFSEELKWEVFFHPTREKQTSRQLKSARVKNLLLLPQPEVLLTLTAAWEAREESTPIKQGMRRTQM